MNLHRFSCRVSLVTFTTLCFGAVLAQEQSSNTSNSKMKYPETKALDVVDDYHGRKVKDPYRWLEDDNSLQTKAWVEKQNAFTSSYLRRIPYRRKIEKRLKELWDYPTHSIPIQKGNKIYFYKNKGLQNQIGRAHV